jgi:beta-glucosidase
VYVAPLGAKWEAPKRLAGWDKVSLQAGESKEVEVTVEPRVLGMFDESSKTWNIAKGQYKLVLAKDASGVDATSVTVELPAQALDVRGHAR